MSRCRARFASNVSVTSRGARVARGGGADHNTRSQAEVDALPGPVRRGEAGAVNDSCSCKQDASNGQELNEWRQPAAIPSAVGGIPDGIGRASGSSTHPNMSVDVGGKPGAAGSQEASSGGECAFDPNATARAELVNERMYCLLAFIRCALVDW